MVQKRKTSTKEDIKEALIQLLSEERFDTISIRNSANGQGLIAAPSTSTTKINIRWLIVSKTTLFPNFLVIAF